MYWFQTGWKLLSSLLSPTPVAEEKLPGGREVGRIGE